ncbi:MAG: alpha/beta hydrolase domain-containing protein, partial [Planctomycetota bacterium]|nr:alpha/beta hydrolase domain-containing protein [Planctomycetota bacterium]
SETLPFNSVPQTDPLTGESDDALGKLRKRGHIPKIMHVVTSTEYWSRGASLLHTDVAGRQDVKSDTNVRTYLVSSAHHLGGGPTTKGICRYPRNPLKDRGCVLRALLTALEQWVEDGREPPGSRHPRLADGTLVDVDTLRKQFPVCTAIPFVPGSFYRPCRLDFGPERKSNGIADILPPKRGKEYRTLVPAVDADGLDIAGIRLPDVTVPVATYTGWNLRAAKHGSPDMIVGLFGSYVEFPRTKQQRLASADPRPSIQERYATKEVYLARVRKAAEDLVAQRLLLAEDVDPIVTEAAKRDFWSPVAD